MRLAKILTFLVLILLSSCSIDSKKITVVSFNIRSTNTTDSLNSWEHRKSLIKDFLKEGDFDIVSFQEVLKSQLDYLVSIQDGYSVVSAGRKDGVDIGEHCSIFFKTSKFDLLAKSYFWLSGDPEEPGSIDWGARQPRIVTWVKLQNKRTGHIFFVFNTHLSHSEYARNKSVMLLLGKIKSIADNVPVIITGDFNMVPGSPPYKLITGNWHNYFSFSDAHKISGFPPSENENTFNDFKVKEGTSRIDYIFVNGYLDVLSFKTFKITKGKRFISDHYPVMAELKFNIERLERNGENKALPEFAPKPVFETNIILFEDSIIVPVRSELLDASIYYTLDGSLPDVNSKKYSAPLIIKETTQVKAVTVADNYLVSAFAERTFVKGKVNSAKLISVRPKPSGNCSAKECSWLFDGKIIDEQMSNSEYLNIHKSDVELVFRLKKTEEVHWVYVSILEDHAFCVYPPKKISVSTSLYGKNFRGYNSIVIRNPFAGEEGRTHILKKIKVSGKAGYIKIKLENPGTCPQEYSDKRDPTSIIIDEIWAL